MRTHIGFIDVQLVKSFILITSLEKSLLQKNSFLNSFYISVFNKCARLHFDITSFEPSTAVRSFLKHKNELISCLQKSFQTSFAAVLCWSFLVCNTCLGYESMRQGQANSASATSIHRYTRLWKFIMLELCWQLP